MAKTHDEKDKHWIDNADSYICPVCGLEVYNPNSYYESRCPKCGFQDVSDAPKKDGSEMTMKRQKAEHEKHTAAFKKELQIAVSHKLDEINHYVSGCDSPFTYAAIRTVQKHLCGIDEALGIDRQDMELP